MPLTSEVQSTTRRTRNSLSRDLILDATQEIAERGDEIAMRSVAALLRCTPMALYRYVPDKTSLINALLDRVIGTIEIGVESDDWAKDLVALGLTHLRVLQSNPWALQPLFDNPDPGPATRKLGEAFLQRIRRSGASNAQCVGVFSSLLAFNYGWAGFTSVNSSPRAANESPIRLATEAPTRDELPITTELWTEFGTLGSESHYVAAFTRLVHALD